jgi:hypothetical protein
LHSSVTSVGSISLGSGCIRYQPASRWYGTDYFGYQVCDTQTPTALCATTVVSVNVVPQPPQAVADVASVNYMQSVDINVLANDVAGPAGVATLTIYAPPSSAMGTASVTSAKRVLFTAAINFHGTATFTYQLCDASIPTPLCSTAQVQVKCFLRDQSAAALRLTIICR